MNTKLQQIEKLKLKTHLFDDIPVVVGGGTLFPLVFAKLERYFYTLYRTLALTKKYKCLTN